jgi:formyl-CoA transferase/CoA:oxalate CoA-transferase
MLGRPDLASDPRFTTNAGRVEHYESLKPALDFSIGVRTLQDLTSALRASGVPGGSVRTVAETLADPQIAARDMVATLQHPTAGAVRVMGTPVKLSDTLAEIRTAPPMLGQHTDAILKHDAGLSDAEIRRLRDAGVI